MTHREKSLTPWITNDPASYQRRVFAAPDREQFARAEYLQDAFHKYAESIGCTFGTGACYDEIMATERQAAMLCAWWEEHKL